MAGADDRIAMEQVIRADLDAEQAAKEFPHRGQVVVDALEQHAVVVDRHAAAKQAVADPLRLRGDFPGVVEVGLDPNLLGRRQQLDQLRVVQSLRQRHRHDGAERGLRAWLCRAAGAKWQAQSLKNH